MGLLEGIFYKFRDDFVEDRACRFKARIGVDFDEPDIVVGVNHEIQSKDLEVVHPPLRVDAQCRCTHSISGYLLHLRIDIPEKIEIGVAFGNIAIQLFIANFVALFVFAVVGQTFLDGIVGEMHGTQAYFKCVFAASCPHVPVAVPVTFHGSVRAIQHHVMPKIEFALLVEQRPLDVLLKDVGFVGAIIMLFLAL